MTIDYAFWSGPWIRDAPPLPHPQITEGNVYAHVASAVTTSSVSAGSSSTAVPELDCPLKPGGLYIFEYNLIYSISGAFVGAQFGVSMLTGGADSIGYSVMLAADGSTLRSVSTTTLGTLIGSGSSFTGGGPWSCNITGSMQVSNASSPVARLLFKGSGVSVGVTLQSNSSAYFQEV